MKIGVVIQARVDSSRLPGKVLMQLPFLYGDTVLGHIVKRLKQIFDTEQIIIATSEETIDLPIVQEAQRLGVNSYQGSKNNVLNRFVQAAKAYNLDTIIRITGDNPIVLNDILDKCISQHINNKVEYTRNSNLPIGTSFEIIQFDTLNKINHILDINDPDREHVTVYVKKNREYFCIQELNHEEYKNLSNVRLTLDYPSDFALINLLFCYLKSKEYNYTLLDISAFFSEYPWISSINNQNIQKKSI